MQGLTQEGGFAQQGCGVDRHKMWGWLHGHQNSRLLPNITKSGLEDRKLTISCQYQDFEDFQDNIANLEFLGLTEDWAIKSWRFLDGLSSGYYDIIVNLSVNTRTTIYGCATRAQDASG
jgi:hypothetical protein